LIVPSLTVLGLRGRASSRTSAEETSQETGGRAQLVVRSDAGPAAPVGARHGAEPGVDPRRRDTCPGA
jgi:hypothetical protein